MKPDEQMREQANAAFRFVVKVGNEDQAVFTECTLPVLELEAEQVKEGGLNTYVHQLPGRRKAATVSLKNGVGKSQLVAWYLEVLAGSFSRKPVTVTLYRGNHEPAATWSISDAFPLKWTGPQLKTDSNTVAIQTLDLACGAISVELK